MPRTRLRGSLDRGVESLTPRECDVMRAVIAHGGLKVVAHSMGISYSSVKNHLVSIHGKLNVDTTVQAVVIYDRWLHERGWPETERRLVDRRMGAADRRQRDQRET